MPLMMTMAGTILATLRITLCFWNASLFLAKENLEISLRSPTTTIFLLIKYAAVAIKIKIAKEFNISNHGY